MKSLLSRRALVGSATAAVAAETAAYILSSPFLRAGGLGARLRGAVLDGDGNALAQDAFKATDMPIFILTVHAKWESAGWLNRPNPKAVGVVGNPDAALSGAFPMHGLTKMFGDYVAPLAGQVGFGIVPTTTTTGNHVYDGLRNTMAKTGCLPSFTAQAQGSLMALNFSSVGTADGATACFSAGGTQLITYGSMQSAVTSLTNALDPLQNLPPAASKLLAELDTRVTSDARFRQGLTDLAGRLQTAREPLGAALAEANVTPPAMAKGAPVPNAMDPGTLKAMNPLIPQVDAATPLIKLGLVHAVTISIANSDPNAGGDHAAAGGNNVAFGAKSPNQVKSCVAQAIAYIYAQFPRALVSITSDGGRQPDGGDSQNFEAFFFGPADVVNTVFVNADSRNDSAQFGSTPPAAALSNGTSAPPTQANVMSTVAKAAGFTLTDTPYIPALLKGA